MNIASPNAATQAEIIPANFFVPLDFENVFGGIAPVEIDLGCGDGSFLVATAAANPARNFLGIDRMAGRVQSACRKIELGCVNNARVLRCEISYAVGQMLPPNSVQVFHLMFPDPWPKRRHARRRIVTESLLNSMAHALAPHGLVRIATDDTEYFRKIEGLAARSPHFVKIAEREAPALASTFETRFRQDEIEIHRLLLRKVSPPRNGVASQ
jgi:tRNA (guanine-N7-)-methyltransferase